MPITDRKEQLIEQWFGLQEIAASREIHYFNSLTREELSDLSELDLHNLCKQLDKLLHIPSGR